MAAKDDLHFAYEQARRFVSARPWERLGQASLYLDLKAWSWHEVCAQHFTNSSATALFLFPGHQNLLGMQRRGPGESPGGTTLAGLIAAGAQPATTPAISHQGAPRRSPPLRAFKTMC